MREQKSIDYSNNKKNAAHKKHIRIEMYGEAEFNIPVKSVMVTGKQILGSRKSQQDAFDTSADTVSYFSDKQRAWAVVCDGMGGMASGDLASKMAKDVMKQILTSAVDGDNIPAVLEQAVRIANENVKSLFPSDDAMSGTTLVCAVIEENRLFFISVGDSRIYVYRKNELVKLTRDHNYYLELSEKVKKGEITLAEAEKDPQKEALISYIGIENLKLIDISNPPVKLENGDIVLLCSDGLTKALSDSEILELINYNYDNIDQMVDSLLFDAQASKPTSLDNTTIAVMKYIEN